MARLTVPRVMMALLTGLLLTYAFAIAPGTTAVGREKVISATAEPSPSSRPASGLFPPAGKAFIGVMTREGPHDFTSLDEFTAAAKRQPQVMQFGSGWASATFDRTLFDRIKDRGMLPMLGWEPWDYRLEDSARKQGIPESEMGKVRTEQTPYRLANIARGNFDPFLTSWAEGIKSLGYPVAIRFAHEMNGFWYPWCELVNGNRPGDYVEAWRHVHDLFKAVGATNVTWVWSPNARWDNSTPKLASLYPGDDYVDWVGISSYFSTMHSSEYRSFDALFSGTIKEIRAFSSKPLVITETGASDGTGRKAEWIREAFQILPRYKDIIGLIWFEVAKEMDWRIVSSPAVAEAFAQAVAAPRYDFSWSPSMLPRKGIQE